MVPVFGIPAATNTLTSRLARMTGATVLPYFLQRLPGTQGYRGVIHPPLENFPSDSPAADTERFNRMIEAQVRAAPSSTCGFTAASRDSRRTTRTITARGAAPGVSDPTAPSYDLLVVGGGINGAGNRPRRGRRG